MQPFLSFPFLSCVSFIEGRFGAFVHSHLDDGSNGLGYHNQSPAQSYKNLMHNAEDIGLDWDGTTPNNFGHYVSKCFFA